MGSLSALARIPINRTCTHKARLKVCTVTRKNTKIRSGGNMTVILKDTERNNTREFDNRSEAEDAKAELVDKAGADPEALVIEVSDSHDTDPELSEEAMRKAQTEVVKQQETDEKATEPAVSDEDITEVTEEVMDDRLPDDGPSVDEDPLVWMPDEFTDVVDGTVTINRKGYEVLAHHYDVTGGTDMVVSPVETEMQYAVHKATVTDAEGNVFEAYGEAHATDNGEENIVRMSDTRAYKRAVSRATGVGTVAIEELQNEL
jgi:hypothetical protein